jgi:hypothetical protein
VSSSGRTRRPRRRPLNTDVPPPRRRAGCSAWRTTALRGSRCCQRRVLVAGATSPACGSRTESHRPYARMGRLVRRSRAQRRVGAPANNLAASLFVHAGGASLVTESWAAAVDLARGLGSGWKKGHWGEYERRGGGPGLGETGRRRMGLAGEERSSGAGGIESGEGQVRGESRNWR